MGTVTAQTLRDRQGVTDGDGGYSPAQGCCKDHKSTGEPWSVAAHLRQLLGPPTPSGSPTHRLSDSGGWRHNATAPRWQVYHWSRTQCWGRCTCVREESERYSGNASGIAQDARCSTACHGRQKRAKTNNGWKTANWNRG